MSSVTSDLDLLNLINRTLEKPETTGRAMAVEEQPLIDADDTDTNINNVQPHTEYTGCDMKRGQDVSAEDMATIPVSTQEDNCRLEENQMPLENPADLNVANMRIDTSMTDMTREEIVQKLIKTQQSLVTTTKNLAKTERQLEKSDNYNSTLRNMIEQLSSDLHQIKNVRTESTYVQVDVEDLLNYTTGDYTMPSWNEEVPCEAVETTVSDPLLATDTTEQVLAVEPLSIADSVKAAAEAVVQQQADEALTSNGYVYDQQSGLYYHHESGYYYNSEKGLYYDTSSYTYFYYNYETGEYQFHSKVDPAQYYDNQGLTQNTQKVKSEQKKKKKKEKKKKAIKLLEGQVFKNRKEKRKAQFEIEMMLSRKAKKSKRKHKHRKHSKHKKAATDEESEWDSELEQVRHRSERSKKRKKRKHHKKSKENHSNEKTKHGTCEDVSKDIDLIKEEPLTESVVRTTTNNISDDSRACAKMECETEDDKNSIPVKMESEQSMKIETEESIMIDTEHIKSDTDTVSERKDDKHDINQKISEEQNSDKTIETRENIKEELDLSDNGLMIHVVSDNEGVVDCIVVSSEGDIESGELSESTDSDSSDDSSDSTSSDSSDLPEADDLHENKELAGSWPPCIRAIVTESDCVDVGMLYMITCAGASIGRKGDGKPDIPLPDINISKVHAEIHFNSSIQQYEITDKGSQNGTFLNDERLSQPKETSIVRPIIHGDVIQVADTKLLCHIHSGTDTCDDCEPGIVMAKHKATLPLNEVKILSAEEKKKIQRQEMNKLKKKYGLKGAEYIDNKGLYNNSKYADRSEERRVTVGSDVPGVEKKTTRASVHRPISAENVGHKLLQKMGWKEGESLGKDNSGIQEPISVNLRANQAAGLGSATAGVFSADDANSVDIRKASRRVQAQQRFNKIPDDTASGDPQSAVGESSDTAKAGNSNIAKTLAKGGLKWTKGDTEFT